MMIHVKDEIWAFWAYDQFPYFLSAKVTHIDETSDMIVVEGYGRYRSTSTILVPGQRGRDLHERLKRIRSISEDEQRKLRIAKELAAYSLLWYVLPCSKPEVNDGGEDSAEIRRLADKLRSKISGDKTTRWKESLPPVGTECVYLGSEERIGIITFHLTNGDAAVIEYPNGGYDVGGMGRFRPLSQQEELNSGASTDLEKSDTCDNQLPMWDGKGEPICGEWCQLIASGEKVEVMVRGAGNKFCGRDESGFIGIFSFDDISPIRSIEDRVVEKMISIVGDFDHNEGVCRSLYQAIRDGDIQDIVLTGVEE